MKTLIRSRPLLFAVLGIAFFTFMVAFMRNTMYMHGESRIPRWDEMTTSLVVGVVALGIGFGSPMAGYLSGGKVELGLVPLGAIGMIVSLFLAAVFLNQVTSLVICVACIGFFTGFYIVPMFTLLQHRAPKESKGDMVATSNFVNVIGAIIASVLFWGVVELAMVGGIIYPEKAEVAAKGELISLSYDERGELSGLQLKEQSGKLFTFERNTQEDAVNPIVVEKEGVLEPMSRQKIGTQVTVIKYGMDHSGERVMHFRALPSTEAIPAEIYNKERLPRYLFLGAGVMTLLILILLRSQLPDLFSRFLLWLQSHGRYHLKVVGMRNLPSDGPVVLATNCEQIESALHVIAASDRSIGFLIVENPKNKKAGWWQQFLATQTDTITLNPEAENDEDWQKAAEHADEILEQENLFGLTVQTDQPTPQLAELINHLREKETARWVPVYAGELNADKSGKRKKWLRDVRVVIGAPIPTGTSLEEVRQRIRILGEWIKQTEESGQVPATVMIPKV